MRLLRAADMTFHEFEGSSIPPYAILSHRWEGDEVTYQEMSDRTTATEKRFRFIKNQELKIRTAATERKSGFKKIRQCCAQALEDMIEYVWVDTCCIDKSSSAELSEAINSMYAWYQQSIVCYAYLADVHIWSTYRKEDADGAWAAAVDSTDWSAFLAGYPDMAWAAATDYTGNTSKLIGRFSRSDFCIARVMKSNWWTRGWVKSPIYELRETYTDLVHRHLRRCRSS